MRNNKFILVMAILATQTAIAQKSYEKIFYNAEPVEAKDFGVKVKDAVAMKKFTKFNLKLANKGNDILVYKPEESKLIIEGKEYIPKEKRLEILPTDADNRVVNLDGDQFMVDHYSFVLNGVYKISDSEKALEAPNFDLPPSSNEFKTGNFTCNMQNLEKETGGTWVKFECRYTGDKYGVIIPSRAALKFPDGTEIANEKSKSKPIILLKGESDKFSLEWDRMEGGSATDMQKIKLLIVWRNCFVESDAVKCDPITLDFKIDETKSK